MPAPAPAPAKSLLFRLSEGLRLLQGIATAASGKHWRNPRLSPTSARGVPVVALTIPEGAVAPEIAAEVQALGWVEVEGLWILPLIGEE